jgi:hypothetical protein
VKIYSSIKNDGIKGNDTLFVSYQGVPPSTIPYHIDNDLFAQWNIQQYTPSALLSAATGCSGKWSIRFHRIKSK